MKGPYERLKYEFRGVWEGAGCRHRERAPGDRAAVHCSCQKDLPLEKQVCMRLIEEGGKRLLPQPLDAFQPPPVKFSGRTREE